MTDHTPEEGGPSFSFEKVRHPAPPERAPAGSDPAADHAAGLAFEATPRAPAPAPPSVATTRDLVATALAGTADAGPRVPAFEAVPASVGVAQQRMSTATIGFRPEVAEVSGVSVPGGKGWNIRRREEEDAFRANAEPAEGSRAWSQRTTPAMTADRSAWEVPAARRSRKPSGRAVLGILLTLVLVAVLGFAAFEWISGRDRATATIATPASVGTLAAIHTPATAAVTQQMEKVMLAHGATRVVSGMYGLAGHPTLVVLLAQGPNIETSSNQFFNDFASGLQTDGVTVTRSRIVQATTGGSQFVCSPATRPAPLTAVSLCGWDDGTTIGMVMDVSGQPVNTTLHEAEQARTAGEH